MKTKTCYFILQWISFHFLLRFSLGKKKNTTFKIFFPNPTNQTHIKTQYSFETYYGLTIIKDYWWNSELFVLDSLTPFISKTN